ncbi:MAG TPA: ABC transporter permease subunit/CPBP intramembrane protease [Candidatus Wallbacteria bacterium]|nr:ABC transporter permease subunit/CPBP intramembrane protease [Candidatus Wallbacteria bacterium]
MTLKFDLSNDKSSVARTELVNAVRNYKSELVDGNISRLNISETLIYPFDINNVNIASPSQIGDSFLARILPMVIIMFATIGAFYPAIDVTAMEKERGTLETLLLAPAGALDIMFGKFLAVFCLTMFSIMINLLSISLTFTHGFFIIQKVSDASRVFNIVNFSISPFSIIAIFIFMVPIACIMSAIMMQVAIFARNFKEAQNYMTPILLVFMLPPMVSLLPGYSLNFSSALVPVVNLTLLLKGMLLSDYKISLALVTFAVNIAFSLIALVAAAGTFASENVLFRPSEDIDVLYFWKYKTLKVNQELNIVKLFFVFQLVLLYYAGSFVQTFFEIKAGLMITEIFLIFLPSFLFIKLVYGNFLKTIEFKVPGPKALAFSIFVALCGFGFTTVITIFQSIICSPPEQMIKQLQKAIMADSAAGFFSIIVITALLPAICEEIMFRGMILNALVKKYSPFYSALICGALFGIFHFSFYRFVPTAVIGFYLSMLKISTGSILPSMAAHFINNFVIVVITNGEWYFEKGIRPSMHLIFLIEGLILFSFVIFPFVIGSMFRASGRKNEAGQKDGAARLTDAGADS